MHLVKEHKLYFHLTQNKLLPHIVFDSPNTVGTFRTAWYQLAATVTSKHLFFKFPGNVGENGYSGNVDIIVRVDTTTISGASVGDRDSLFVSGKPLFYDYTTSTYEVSAAADQDSIVIGASTGAGINWGSTVSDITHLLRADLDVQLCHAIFVNVVNGSGAPVDFRAYIRISKTNR